jgi:UDP-N-acetylglucosamine 2-epimerase (non-hydrolysing)
MKKTILSIFGTRPEAIKMAPVIRELARHPEGIISKVCVTAQHRQMLDQVLDLFGIVPDFDLNLMANNQTPSQVAASALTKLEPILQEVRPDWVLVQGDTTTVAAASLAAFLCRAKVGHVEAGLRTYDKWSPFPEEIMRRIAGVIADLHFTPTEQARQNLLREATPAASVLNTGNTVVDAVLWAAQQPFDLRTLPLAPALLNRLLNHDPSLDLILVTAHRRESFGEPFNNICRALRELAIAGNGRTQIVYPVHLNPNVQEPVNRILRGSPNVHLLPPLDYLPLVHLMKRARLALTDSGGIQEEAPGFGIPVLVMRNHTERPEGVEAGTAKLVGTDQQRIVAETQKLLNNSEEYAKMAKAVNPYGDGNSAARIVETLLKTP